MTSSPSSHGYEEQKILLPFHQLLRDCHQPHFRLFPFSLNHCNPFSLSLELNPFPRPPWLWFCFDFPHCLTFFSRNIVQNTKCSTSAETVSVLRGEEGAFWMSWRDTHTNSRREKIFPPSRGTCGNVQRVERSPTGMYKYTESIKKKRTENLNMYTKEWTKSTTLQHLVYYATRSICTSFSQQGTVPYSSSPHSQLIIYRPTSM